MRRLCLGVLVVVTLAACQHVPPRGPEAGTIKTQDQQMLDVYESLLRRFFTKYETPNSRGPTYYIFVDEKDPSPAFLARFAGHDPLVVPGSGFAQVRFPQMGVALWVSGKWVDENTVELDITADEGPLVGGSWHCTAKRKGQGWAIGELQRDLVF